MKKENKPVITVLKKMNRWYSSEKKWCQGAYAKTKDHHEYRDSFVSFYTERDTKKWKTTVCCCLTGAIFRYSPNEEIVDSVRKALILEIRKRAKGFWGVTGFNDFSGTTFNDIKSLIKSTIQSLENEK